MKKLLFLLMASLVLVACGNDEPQEKEVGSVESSDKANNSNNESNNNSNEDESNTGEEVSTEEVEEVIADDDFLKATLVSVERIEDDIFGDSHVVNIQIENKTSDKLVVQSEDVSIDGTMVDDMVVFSEDIAGEKNANGKLEIMSFEDDLPEMNDNIEFTLIVLDEETYDRVAEHEVKIDF